jgi:hypothetical protein
LASAGVAWNQSQGRPLTITPFLGLGTALASVLVDGYYLARNHARDIEYAARLKAQPLIDLKGQLLNELKAGSVRLNALKSEVERLEDQKTAASQLSSLDRNAVQSLLVAIGRPARRDIWVERSFGFVSGIAASLVASVLYELAKR